MTKKQKLYLKELEKQDGNLKLAADSFGVAFKTVYNWCKQYPDFEEEVLMIQHKTDDDIKNVLVSTAKKGSLRAIEIYYRYRHLMMVRRENKEEENESDSQVLEWKLTPISKDQ